MKYLLFLLLLLFNLSAFGQTKVLVNLLNFADDQSRPYTDEVIAAQLTQTDAFYRESVGVSFHFEVRPWRTLPINKTCNDLEIEAAAGAEPGYEKIIYIYPGPCWYAGLGYPWGKVFLTGVTSYVIAHELGHTYGLSHSASVTWGGVVNGYGDPFCVMGSGLHQFNAIKKERAGWLTVPRVQTGTYRINSYQAIKILKERASGPGFQDIWYYIEFRQPYGFDAVLFNYGVQNGVLVHKGHNQTGEGYLLDMQPFTSHFYDAYLTGSWTDGVVSISVSSVDATGATVDVVAPVIVDPTPTPTPTPTPCKKFNGKGKCIKF